jgi:hypothetical protein
MNAKPIMYIENDRVEKSAELITLLWSFGYDLFWHITPYYNPDNFFKNRNNIYGNSKSFNMLCVHQQNGLKIDGVSKIVDKEFHPLKKVS